MAPAGDHGGSVNSRDVVEEMPCSLSALDNKPTDPQFFLAASSPNFGREDTV